MVLSFEPDRDREIPSGASARSKSLVEEHRELQRRYRLMKKGLDRAARIQQSLLPPRSPSVCGFELAHFYRPCEEVGGDFYDFVENGDGLVLLVSDVIGHGFEAALTTMLMKELFEEVATAVTEPEEVLGAMNSRLHRALPEGMFVAAAVAKLVAEPPGIEFANAGLPYPFVLRASEARVEEVPIAGFPLGLFNGDVPVQFDTTALTLERGDVLLLSSDGIHAVAGNENGSFDAGRLPRLLERMMGRPGREVIDALLAEVRCDGADPLPDDVNLVAVTRVGASH